CPAAVSVTGIGDLNLCPAQEYRCGHVLINVPDSGRPTSHSFTGDANHNASSDSKTYIIAKAESATVVTVAGGVSFTYDGLSHPAAVAMTRIDGLNDSMASVYICGHVPINFADSGCTASHSFTG